MKHSERLHLVLKKAILVRNLSLGVLICSALLLIQVELFPNALNFKQNNEAKIEQIVETSDFDPFFGLDSIEVKNGIHTPTGLIVDTSVMIVRATCTACHSINLVTQNKADRKGWKDMIVWMQESQGLWDLGANEDLILNYLAKNYAPKDTGRRKNLKNIEWYEL